MEVTFSVNSYDKDGDILEGGIFLHFGGTRVKVCEGINNLDEFVRDITAIAEEIKENY